MHHRRALSARRVRQVLVRERLRVHKPETILDTSLVSQRERAVEVVAVVLLGHSVSTSVTHVSQLEVQREVGSRSEDVGMTAAEYAAAPFERVLVQFASLP